MDNILSKTIKVDGLDVRYYTAGKGDPLVVVHGGGGDARTWWGNISELAGRYTIFAPDLPGYGGSQPLEGKYFIPELSDFLDRFARSIGLDKFNLMGHSLGGGIAIDYALKFPQKINKLVLVSSLCLGRDIALWVRVASLKAIVRSMGTLTMGIVKGVGWIIKQFNPLKLVMPLSPAAMAVGGNITTFKQQTLVLEHRLCEINAPTLVVWGAKDNVVPVKHAYSAARAIPRCIVKVFEKRGHNVHRDEMEQFSSIITGFLG
jgi:4,5:9,10-diseco-3-hydroxy-5,9,17-trioxoandrosta-1(10),2-diene-4-oate hydrolase